MSDEKESPVIMNMLLIVGTAFSLYGLYQGCVFLKDKIRSHLSKIDDYPESASEASVYFSDMSMSCNNSAWFMFNLLTGIDLRVFKLNMSLNNVDYDFDEPSQLSSGKIVYYYAFGWKNPEEIVFRVNSDECHHFVYCDGYVYQTYKATKNTWPYLNNDYPLLKIRVESCDTVYFENGASRMNIATFNHYCAPSITKIDPSNTHFKCITRYRALLNPTRSSTTLKTVDI